MAIQKSHHFWLYFFLHMYKRQTDEEREVHPAEELGKEPHVSSRVVQCEADCNSSSCMEHVCDDVYQAQSLEGKGRIKKNKTSKYKRSSAVRATVTPHNFGRSIGTT